MKTEYCFCSVIESPQIASVSPACNCAATGAVWAMLVLKISVASRRPVARTVIIVFFIMVLSGQPPHQLFELQRTPFPRASCAAGNAAVKAVSFVGEEFLEHRTGGLHLRINRPAPLI